jgi:sugar lactone lactonase YvrE
MRGLWAAGNARRRRGAMLAGVVLVSMLAALPASASPRTAGTRLWAKDFDGTASDDDQATATAFAPDGSRLFVAGFTTTTDRGKDFLVLAHDATTGRIEWGQRYGGRGDDAATAVAVTPDGRDVVATGWRTTHARTLEYQTLALDPTTGSILWRGLYEGRGGADAQPNAVAVSPDGTRAYVTGWSTGTDGARDFATLAYDVASGRRLWARTYTGTPLFAQDDAAVAVASSPDGKTVFVTGSSPGYPAGESFVTIAYDAATGANRWLTRERHGITFEQAKGLAVSPDGSLVYVTGSSSGVGADTAYLTIAYDTDDGLRVWSATYDGGRSIDDPVGMVASPDGSRVFVTGYSLVSGDYGTVTVAHDAATGLQLWFQRTPGSGDFAHSLAVAPDGSILYVTGTRAQSGQDEFLTVAYGAADGTELWSAEFGASWFAGPRGIAVRPNGSSVAVTGLVTSSLSARPDVATIVYSTA